MVDRLVALDEVGAGQLGDDAVDRLREHLGIPSAMRPSTMPSLRWRIVSAIAISRLRAQHRRERLVGRGELDDREVLAVLVEPRERRRGCRARCGAPGSASSPIACCWRLRRSWFDALSSSVSSSSFDGEVPVEDALADAERVDDVGDRGGVVAPLGEEPGRAGDQLLAALPASRRELAAHRRPALLARLDRPVNDIGAHGADARQRPSTAVRALVTLRGHPPRHTAGRHCDRRTRGSRRAPMEVRMQARLARSWTPAATTSSSQPGPRQRRAAIAPSTIGCSPRSTRSRPARRRVPPAPRERAELAAPADRAPRTPSRAPA